MNNKATENKPSRSALSRFFLAAAMCWGVLWLVYVISGIPIVMLTRSVAYDPAAMTAGQSLMLDIANFSHAALRWVFPFCLPLMWLTVLFSGRNNGSDRRIISKIGVLSIVTCAVILLILVVAHAALPIDRLREGSGIVNNLLIRLHAVLMAAPVGLAALACTLFARACGKLTGSEKMHSFGKMAVIAAAAMLAVTLIAAFATVIKGTWMNIDWIVILPMAASVIFECARTSKELPAESREK